MKCPVCQVELKIADRLGIEIDYCPNCRGVWLDRGELDKIIDRAFQESSPRKTPSVRSAPPPEEYDDEPYEHRDYPPRHSHDRYKRRKKRNWLEEIFDVFD